MVEPMLYAPHAAQRLNFNSLACVSSTEFWHRSLAHQGFQCARAMRRSLCSNIPQTPMLTTGNCSPCWIVSTVSQGPLGPAGWCLGMPHVVSLNRHAPSQTWLAEKSSEMEAL